MTEERVLTFGEKAAGVGFNPSNDPEVDQAKAAYARIIDNLNDRRNSSPNNEVKRMLSLAITQAQESQMWAVKALTWRHE